MPVIIESAVSSAAGLAENSELLDKKVVNRQVDARLDLSGDLSMSDELIKYLQEILSLDDEKVKNIIGVFNDYSSEVEVG